MFVDHLDIPLPQTASSSHLLIFLLDDLPSSNLVVGVFNTLWTKVLCEVCVASIFFLIYGLPFFTFIKFS